ncbi:hypothetical protein [Rufibacter ruber]|uniref:hypothetical protein n=1 Tax=Rufibacter ruber TaxID=1783499 RepID=UPI000A8A504C|nr:hypothetical protein [Rufibacter ruber]
MKDKYNQIRLAQYSQELAQRLSEEHFAQHEVVTAPQLISFTPIKQVNLYLIRELLTLWNHEMANLRSPYFDFESPEVKDALVQFMNVLSRKISIKRPHFEPLLQKAIQDTFRTVLEPVEVFEEKFLRVDDLSPAKLQEGLKYQDLDKELYRQFIDSLSEENLDRGKVTTKLQRFLNEHNSLRFSVADVVTRFNELKPLKMDEILTPEAPVAPVVPSIPVVPATPPPPAAAPAPTPVAAVPPVPTAPSTNGSSTSSGAAASPFFRPEVNMEPKLNERFQQEQKQTLNDRFKQPVNASLADRQQDQKIGSLKDAISINQRFSFINELFEGDNMAYHAIIKQLDEFGSADEAKQFLLKEVGSKYNWSKKEEHVQKLVRLIERKFA